MGPAPYACFGLSCCPGLGVPTSTVCAEMGDSTGRYCGEDQGLGSGGAGSRAHCLEGRRASTTRVQASFECCALAPMAVVREAPVVMERLSWKGGARANQITHVLGRRIGSDDLSAVHAWRRTASRAIFVDTGCASDVSGHRRATSPSGRYPCGRHSSSLD